MQGIFYGPIISEYLYKINYIKLIFCFMKIQLFFFIMMSIAGIPDNLQCHLTMSKVQRHILHYWV